MPPEAVPQVSDQELMMSNTLTIKAEFHVEYVQELRLILPQARRLPACLALEVGEITGQTGTFVLCERWRSGREYMDEILHLEFYQRYLQLTEPYYAGPRIVLVLQSVS